jgi:hypothetical protein
MKDSASPGRRKPCLIDPLIPFCAGLEFFSRSILYKIVDSRYYNTIRIVIEIRMTSFSRCSSMVERSFRKAEVVGPTPTIGCSLWT